MNKKLVLFYGGPMNERVLIVTNETKKYIIPELGKSDHAYRIKGCEGYYVGQEYGV